MVCDGKGSRNKPHYHSSVWDQWHLAITLTHYQFTYINGFSSLDVAESMELFALTIILLNSQEKNNDFV